MSATRIENALNTLKTLTDELARILPFKGLVENFKLPRIPRIEWPPLRIGDLVAPVPVVQGGMGVGISLSGLASAVAEAGGIGVIAANGIGMLEKNYFKDGRAANLRAFRREIRTARKKTKGILGVNIMVAVNDFHELLDVAIDEEVDVVIMGAGLPIKGLPVEKMREHGVKALPIVSSVRATQMIYGMWKKIYGDVPDGVVFEGPKAGGHLGFSQEQLEDPDYALEAIVPGIAEVLKPFEEEFGRTIPVIAAGGIYDGEDIRAALDLGAAGVQMGTRFVATEECDADEAFKQAYVECSTEDIGIIKSPVGMPGRAIRNEFIEDSEAGRRPSFKCAWQCLSHCEANGAKYCISVALNNARRGKLRHGFVFAGSNAYRVDKIVPVADLMTELAEGYRAAAWGGIVAKLEGLVARVGELGKQYEGVAARVIDAAAAYEKALALKVREARDSGVDSARKRYDSVQASLRELQYQIAESLADSWALLKNPGNLA